MKRPRWSLNRVQDCEIGGKDGALIAAAVRTYEQMRKRGIRVVIGGDYGWQTGASGAVHWPQNFIPPGFSEPHFEQRIDAPANQGNRPLLYHPTSATDQQATEGRWQYVPLPSKAVGDRRWRGFWDARDGPLAKRNV
jgi:hypothetical protein